MDQLAAENAVAAWSQVAIAFLVLIVTIASVCTAVRQYHVTQKQSELLGKQHDAQIFKFMLEILQSNSARNARHHVHHVIGNAVDHKWERSDRDKARVIATTFDAAAKIAEQSLWAEQALLSWDILKNWDAIAPAMEHWKKNERGTIFFPWFEQLAREVRDGRKTPMMQSLDRKLGTQ